MELSSFSAHKSMVKDAIYLHPFELASVGASIHSFYIPCLTIWCKRFMLASHVSIAYFCQCCIAVLYGIYYSQQEDFVMFCALSL